MKVVFIKNNNYLSCDDLKIDGFKFVPKRKNIGSLIMVDNSLTKNVLNKKIERIIKNLDRTVKLIINSNVTMVEDCNMMEKELVKTLKLIENRYLYYFTEFEFFDYIKSIYILNMSLILKKKMISEVL